MKPNDVIKVLASQLGSADLPELNKRLKTKESLSTKYKIMGEKFGYIGYTVAIKAVTPEGVKIIDVNRVKLIRFVDMESFEKARPREKRPVYPKKVVEAPKKAKTPDASLSPEKAEKEPALELGIKKKKSSQLGSSFIPAKSKR